MSHQVTDQDLQVPPQQHGRHESAPQAPQAPQARPAQQSRPAGTPDTRDTEQLQVDPHYGTQQPPAEYAEQNPIEEQPAQRASEQQTESAGQAESGSLDTGQVPGTSAMSAQFAQRPSDAEIDEIETERQRRLENRPPNSEVDNTQRVFNTELGRFEDCDSPLHKR